MKTSFCFILLIISFFCRANCRELTDTVPGKERTVSFKSVKLYCSDFAKTKYKLSTDGSKITITRFYKEYTDKYSGIIKHGKIYSNNPDEKNIKNLQGKYYKLEGKNFGVLNIENGDYEWFTECKR